MFSAHWTHMKTTASLTAAIIVASLAACASRPQAPQDEQEPVTQTASARAASSTDVRTFTIGTYSAVALRDGGGNFPNDNKVFAVGRTPADVAAVLSAAKLPTERLDLSIQPLLVQTADRVLLFDTGAGGYMGGSGGKLPAALETAGISPVSITDIFISHAHGDHVGGLVNASGALAFPGATIHISAPEWAFLKGLPPQLVTAFGITDHAALIAAMTPKVAEFVPDADIVPGVVKAVAIQGHTPGHSGYRITSGKRSLLYIGDVAHHFVVSVRHPEWTIAFDADPPTAQASRKALLTQSATNKQLLYSPHFPFPGLGRIERRGEGFAWVAQ
jgi:glyoxylase-like metal-dependent hydrolase (beta-lactamase superfamily II)